MQFAGLQLPLSVQRAENSKKYNSLGHDRCLYDWHVAEVTIDTTNGAEPVTICETNTHLIRWLFLFICLIFFANAFARV